MYRAAFYGLMAVGVALPVALPLTVAAAPRIPTHIACVGDSITYGAGDTTADGGPPLGPYPQQLQQILSGEKPPVQVGNFGHPGATALSSGDLPYINQTEYTAATNFVNGAGATAIVDVVLMLGTNDSKPQNWDGGVNSAEFTSDYTALVAHFEGLATKPVVYVMIPPVAAAGNAFNIDPTVLHDDIAPLIQSIAMQDGLPVIDLYSITVNMPQLFVDGIHPTDVGYTLIANTVASALLGGVPIPPEVPLDASVMAEPVDAAAQDGQAKGVPSDGGSAAVDASKTDHAGDAASSSGSGNRGGGCLVAPGLRDDGGASGGVAGLALCAGLFLRRRLTFGRR
jgi:acyl-CoA thioesterase-1